MPRVLLALTIAAGMATAGSAAAAAAVLPGHIGFEAGPSSPVTVGAEPRAIAVGDLNGDGNLDFATADRGPNTITPVYGNGLGGFTPGAPLGAGDNPESIVLADFDGDTRLDIAVGNRSADTVWVLLQEAPGAFNALEPISSGGDAPVAIAVGRLDDNESPDLVVANSGGDTGSSINVTVLLNEGTGFSPPEGGAMPSSVASGVLLDDFDEDGELDLYVTGGVLRLGLGDGTFGAATQVASTGARLRVASADVDGDGHHDLVVPGSSVGTSSTTMVLLGNGGGGFHLQEDSLLAGGQPFYPSAIAIARFNADPFGDLLATRPTPGTGGADTAGTARVFLGDDDGGLTSTNVDGPWTTGLGPNAVAVGDFDEDGRPDFVAANSGTAAANTVSVLLNTTPWPALQFPTSNIVEMGNFAVNTISGVATLDIHNSGGEVLRVRRTEFAGSNPDDFVKTSDSCTGMSIPPQGFCAINVRFAPAAAAPRSAELRLFDNTVAGSHTAFLSGVGTAATGCGGTGPQGPAGPAGPAGSAGPQGTPGANGTNGASGPRGTNGTDGRSGATGPQGPAGPQGATGPRGPAGRNATVRCKPKRSRSGNVRVTCTVRFASRVARSSVRVRLVRGSTVYGTARRTVRRGRVAIRVRARSRMQHARYRLLLTFVDRKGRATTVSQRVRLSP